MKDDSRESGAETVALLEECRAREKSQALFYRTLAARAESRGAGPEAERLNELHADEQHHLSRLTARLLELGGHPADLRSVLPPNTHNVPEDWESEARRRESEEVEWYEEVLRRPLDEATKGVVAEILTAERHHKAELRGKWMSA